MTAGTNRLLLQDGRKFWLNDCEAVLGIMSGLLIIGGLNVFSSSFVMAEMNFGTPYFFLQKHAVNLAGGILFLLAGVFVNYHRWRAVMPLIFGGILISLVLVLFIGTTINGAQRWLPLAGIQFQPAEFAKVVAVFIEASYIASCVRAGRPCRLLNRQWFFLGAMAILIEREPDGATASIVAGVPLVMLFFSNMRKSEKLWMAGLSALAGCIICWVQPYRLARIVAMFNPWADPQGTGYQVVQSLQAIGSGGLTGMGLGVGVSKYHYLPEAHTDFAFAVWCQETGFLGALVVFGLFASLVYYGVRIARAARDPLGQNLAFGLTALIVGQALANLFMVGGWGPVIGVPLPFISYGGSSLAVSLWSVGILLNIGWKSVPAKTVMTSAPLPEPDMSSRPHLRRVK